MVCIPDLAHIKQTLADLADANLQLTYLNRLAQGLREAAEEARHAKQQFVANVSHESRTPLNMVIGFSEIVLQAPGTYWSRLPRALLTDLEIIHRNSQHLSSLINDVLDLSQIEARQVPLTCAVHSGHRGCGAGAVVPKGERIVNTRISRRQFLHMAGAG